jgi:branched-chain amino acid transport system ATP-binding protein
MTILDVASISKSFGGVRAVADVSFQVAAGEMLALIGPNGAGKSTCFNMLNGQIPPDAGRITLDGQNITAMSPRRICRMGVGRTFQITATFASMTVRENVQVALLADHRRVWRFIRPAAAWFAADADALLAQVGMHDQASSAAGVLAYGDLKRLQLAIALATPHICC